MRTKSTRNSAVENWKVPASTRESGESGGKDGARILTGILEKSGFSVMGRQTLAGRSGNYSPVPVELHPEIRDLLENQHPQGLYSHQSKAIQSVLDGSDVCLSTSTASGKSLAFMAVSAHCLLSDNHARILVIYPSKALIQDQAAKWQKILEPMSMNAGIIDGSIPQCKRKEIMSRRRVILMTPDVLHAWLMSHLDDKVIAAFRTNLKLLVLDETHAYDGSFGTNMAFLLRRFRAVTAPHRLICSTATVGEAGEFIRELTGREAIIIGQEMDGARAAEKEILMARKPEGDAFEATAKVLRLLAQQFTGRFIAFADSRKAVEMMTVASMRQDGQQQDLEAEEAPHISLSNNIGILPFRAGYESVDREEIQKALANGGLRGVVATSALEVGLDIGDIDLVLLLDTPSSMKSFWQRIGRAGRSHKGFAVILDTRGFIEAGDAGLEKYLARPIEPNRLYLLNRYAQYTNALCAAAEVSQLSGDCDQSHFESLPESFRNLLENELNPITDIPADLYPFKQAAQSGPHYEFPLRNSMEKQFELVIRDGIKIGSVSFSNVLREAYPGAVYYHMARPYRVQWVNQRERKITLHDERAYSTKPICNTMVFPQLGQGALHLQKFTTGFVVEAEMQVSERTTGFKEKRGPSEITNTYETGSPYSQQPLLRFIRTTGVCWSFTQAQLVTDAIGDSIMEAFCGEYGIQARDLGLGRFKARNGPEDTKPVSGVCIFDNSNGSLRLTERLGANFKAVVTTAQRIEEARGNTALAEALTLLLSKLRPAKASFPTVVSPPSVQDAGIPEGWVRVIAPASKAMIVTDSAGAEEVTILGHFYTPAGLQYHVSDPIPTVRRLIPADRLQLIHGVTVSQLYNLMTGELKEAA